MMLNAMAPQRHHQQPAGSPLLLTTTSSSTTSSSLSSSSSSSNSSTSLSKSNHSSSSSKQNTNTKNDHDATARISRSSSQADNSSQPPAPSTTATSASTTTTNTSSPSPVKTTAIPTTTGRSSCLPQTQKQATINDTTRNSTANTLKTTTITTTMTTTPSATTTTNSSNNIQQQQHYHNNSYQSHRSLNNQYNNNNTHHHNNSNFASRPSNQHRTHNSGNHNHNHHNQHQQSSQGHLPSETSCSNNVAVNSSTTTSMPSGDSIVLSPASASTPANQRQHHQHNGPPHYVDLHVNAGECVSLQMLDGQEQVVAGPTTITMISQQQNPPVPIPVQAPPGHMIHQIADENGTLKHIILSVINSDETNAQLDSTVITLPQGTFRINSHGELVSIGSDGGNGDSSLPLTTLSQQAYFANYDGCPVAYNATPSTHLEADNIDSTVAPAILPIMTDTTEAAAIATTNNNIDEKATARHSEQQDHVKDKSVIAGSSDKNKSIKGKESSNKENIVTGNHDRQVSVVPVSNLSQTTPVVDSLVASSEQAPKEESSTSLAVSSSTASEAEQMVVPTSVSDTSYTTNHHQVMPTTEVDIMGGAMAPPILSTVDGQLYSYPPCCCCCYCDPQEATSATTSRGAASGGGLGHSQQQHQDQHPQQNQHQSGHQPPLTMAGLSEQHQQDIMVGPTESHSNNHNTPHGSGSSRMSSRGSANSLANGVMAYGPPLIGPPMQSNFALPISVVGPHGTQIIQPLQTNSQNGMQTIQGPGMGLPSEQQQQQQQQQQHSSGKVHSGKGSRGSSNCGYKQHKINSSGSSNQSDRQQQSYNSNHYNSASYNNIVSGHHHQQQSQQNPYHNHHHHHNQTSDQSSPFVKSQALLPNQMIGSGNYSPVYSNYNHVQANLATILSSSKVGQQQTSSYVRAPPESDNYMQPQQRGSREPMSYSNHVGNNYPSPNVRSNGQQQQQQQQQHNESKRQNLGDKSSSMTQHNSNNSRYNSSANVKILANNHLSNSNSQPTSGNSSHHQAGSISPMRGRMKGSSSTQYHHQTNGVRASNYYNQIQHDSKDNSMISAHSTSSSICQQHAPRDSGISVNHHVNHVKAKTVYPHGRDQHVAPANKSKQHINTNIPPYYQSQAQGAPENKGAWQSNLQNKPTSNNGLTHDSEGANFRNNGGQKPNQPSEPQINKQPEGKSSIRGSDLVDPSSSPSLSLSASNDRHNSTSAKSNGVGPKNQDGLDSRSSRGKQKKCQINQTIKNNSSSELQSADRLEHVAVITETANKSDYILNDTPYLNDQDGKSDQSNKVSKLIATRPDSLSQPVKDNSSTKQQHQPRTQSKNGNQKRIRDKSSSQQQATSKPEDTSQQPTVDGNNGLRHSHELIRKLELSDSTIGLESDLKRPSKLTPIDSKRRNSNGDYSSPAKALSSNRQLSDDQLRSLELDNDERAEFLQRKHRNKHNINQQATTYMHGQIKNESSPARAGTATKKNSMPSQSSLIALKTEGSQADLEPLVIEELDNDVVLMVSRSDSPITSAEARAPTQHQAPSLNISMRTSYSENNIQSLDTSNSSVKSTQTTPQKFPLAANSTTNELLTVAKSGNSSSDSGGGKKNHSGGDKKRGSSARTDHKIKSSSMPQLCLLNLNCTSVTSSSVQLRWSYIPNLAEKYGIHPHSSGSKSVTLMDHFVIESSGAKNVETNTLISPKVVYQGCSFTCRVNHLSSEKIYHFKVRRTALVTTSNKGESQSSDESGNSEHLVVSEILSVTLPSVQQYQQQLNADQKQQQHHQCFGNKKSNSSGSKSSNNSLIDYHQATASSSSGAHHESGSMTASVSSGTLSAYRGNSSSHHNNSNNGKTLLPSIKFSSLIRQCRTKIVTMLGRLVQNSLSSYSDTKFAGLLLILFTIFAMLLAIFIHLYIVAPVSE